MRWVRVVVTVLLSPPLFLLAAFCAGAAVAAHFGRVSAEWDLLTHFAPFWLAGAVLAFAAGWAFEGYVRALIVSMGAVGIVAAGLLILPELLRDTGPKAAAGAVGEIKVIQFNISVRNADFDRTVDWLIAEQPDIVVLEETRPEIRRLLAERTDWHVTCGTCEVMILSRRPPHPPPLIERKPGPLAQATFRDDLGRFTVIGVHYAWPTDIAIQQAQEARLARVIARRPRERTIVAGDLNSTPWSFFRRRWDAEFGLIRRERALFSWPALRYKRLRWLGFFPFLPIDHVYAGPGWATVKVERGPRLGSDHYPLVVTLSPVAPL